MRLYAPGTASAEPARVAGRRYRDTEAAWRAYLPTVRRFYSGDYSPIRLYATLSGLAQVEQATPRIRLELLMQREVVHVLELTEGVN